MSEFLAITHVATEALARGEIVCMATVVRVRGSTPRHASARMLIWPDGKTFGTIGGGTLEHRVIEDACSALARGESVFKNYVFDTREGVDSVGLCGGSVDLHMEVLKPDPVLLLIGAGHIAQPLAQMATMLEMQVAVVDDRPDWANKERFPDANKIQIVDYDEATGKLTPILVPMTSMTYVVIATWGYDLPALEQALTSDPAFIGLVASPTKAREFFKKLMAKGFSGELLQQVHTPLGLDIGAESPSELALSILAEVLAFQRKGSGRSLREVRGHAFAKVLDQKAE